MKEREIIFLDEKELLEKVKTQGEEIRKKAGINLKSRFPVVECRE